MKEFENYVEQTVAHCKDRDPRLAGVQRADLLPLRVARLRRLQDGRLRPLYRAFCPAAQRADPKCRILGGYCLAGMPLTRDDWKRVVPGVLDEWMRFISLGGLEHLDVFTLHAYPGRTPPEHVEPLLQAVGKAMNERGRRAGPSGLPSTPTSPTTSRGA